jgi:alpha-1,2-mannosyltransferase
MAQHSAPRRFAWSERHTIAHGVGLLSLGLSLWQLTKPGFFSFYDSGIYLAASIHFISGSIPYRYFVFVHPPGILLLMSPVALISRIFGSHDGFVVARMVSAVVTASNATLLAWLVRYRGRTAMLIAGGGLALLPVASFVSTGVELEPYLICLVLLGSLTVFPFERARAELTTRRLVVGGLFFGAAALVSLWALFPFLALVFCLVPRYRRRVLLLIGSAAAGFVMLALPFYLMAGNNFISQVFGDQLTRVANVTSDGGVISRFITMTGFSNTSLAPTTEEAIVAVGVLLLVVVLAYTRRVGHATVDHYLLVASLVSMSALLVAPESYTYYGYFTAPFLLGVFGISLARLGPSMRELLGTKRASKSQRQFGYAVYVLVAGALVVALIAEGTSFYSNYTRTYGYYNDPFYAITNLIPAGSCVVYDQVSYGVFANRLDTSDPNCPSVVDPDAVAMAQGYQLSTPRRPHLSTSGSPISKRRSTWY